MPALPPEQTPLYNHPQPAQEQWLRQLGARQRGPHAVVWDLQHAGWTAEIVLESENLAVSWQGQGQGSQCRFPYGLNRADVEAAILAGP
jgi:hypothetical protein